MICYATAMSVNQDLHALATLYNDGSEGNAQGLLMRLGKRASQMSVNQDLHGKSN